jgi:hypothetical protein
LLRVLQTPSVRACGAGIVRSMRDYNKPWRGWGAVASVALHLAVVSPFIFRLAEALPKPPEQNIKVEIVPPEQPPLPEKPAAQPEMNKAQQALPPAPPPKPFQSAPGKVNRLVTTPQLPSADENPMQNAGSADGGDEPAAKTEVPPASGKPPRETKQDPAKLSLSQRRRPGLNRPGRTSRQQKTRRVMLRKQLADRQLREGVRSPGIRLIRRTRFLPMH